MIIKVYKRYQKDVEVFGYQEAYEALLDFIRQQGHFTQIQNN